MIVILTIEGRSKLPPLTGDRYAEQVEKLRRAGIKVPSWR